MLIHFQAGIGEQGDNYKKGIFFGCYEILISESIFDNGWLFLDLGVEGLNSSHPNSLHPNIRMHILHTVSHIFFADREGDLV